MKLGLHNVGFFNQKHYLKTSNEDKAWLDRQFRILMEKSFSEAAYLCSRVCQDEATGNPKRFANLETLLYTALLICHPGSHCFDSYLAAQKNA